MENLKCPRCGSTDLRKHGFKYLTNGKKAQLYQCRKCHMVFRPHTKRIRLKRNLNIAKKETFKIPLEGLSIAKKEG